MFLTVNEVLYASGGSLCGTSSDDRPLRSAYVDSRKVSQDSLFVCIEGGNVDGHDFALQAVQSGASAVLAQRDPFAKMPSRPDAVVILVPDTVKALSRIALYWRRKCSETAVICVTGTAGKTTVKELLAQALSSFGKTAKTFLNLNNQIGLPLSMLSADGDERYWVFEAGISHPQDMDELAATAEPDIGLILNAGTGHTEGLGDRGTAYYKSRLLHFLKQGGFGVVSADYPDLVKEACLAEVPLHFFSASDASADCRAEYIGPEQDRNGVYRISLYNGESFQVSAPFRGSCGCENLAAVALTMQLLGLDPGRLRDILATCILPVQRCECLHAGKWLVINDSYNANPLSFRRMLETASDLALSREESFLACVLGEMGELGEVAEAEHESLGKTIALNGASLVIWKGRFGDAVERGLRSCGFQGRMIPYLSPETPFQVLKGCKTGGTVLFKGSRVNRLEESVQDFLKKQEEK
ncbi:MAG: Mur ligase family protein [Desulfovibrionaceae bacterium]|nr:Mur ligase family protein [Desulfovibrionaceae bacterium]